MVLSGQTWYAVVKRERVARGRKAKKRGRGIGVARATQAVAGT